MKGEESDLGQVGKLKKIDWNNITRTVSNRSGWRDLVAANNIYKTFLALVNDYFIWDNFKL